VFASTDLNQFARAC